MTYYVDFIDGMSGYKTLTEARKAAIREFKGYMGQMYSLIDIYPNKHTNKQCGYVWMHDGKFYYTSFSRTQKGHAVALNLDGTEKIK